MPILELTNTALLCISTPLDEFNYYSKLVEQKDENGNPFFKTIKAGRVCDDCSRLPHEQMLKCDHIKDGAHWKNPHKLKRLKVSPSLFSPLSLTQGWVRCSLTVMKLVVSES